MEGKVKFKVNIVSEQFINMDMAALESKLMGTLPVKMYFTQLWNLIFLLGIIPELLLIIRLIRAAQADQDYKNVEYQIFKLNILAHRLE